MSPELFVEDGIAPDKTQLAQLSTGRELHQWMQRPAAV